MSQQDETKRRAEKLHLLADAAASESKTLIQPAQARIEKEAVTKEDDTVLSPASPTSEYAAQHAPQHATKRSRAVSSTSETRPTDSKKPRVVKTSTEQTPHQQLPMERRPIITDSASSRSISESPLQKCIAARDLSYDLLSQCGHIAPNILNGNRLSIVGQSGNDYCPRYLFTATPIHMETEGKWPHFERSRDSGAAQIMEWCKARRHTLHNHLVFTNCSTSLRNVLTSLAFDNRWSKTRLFMIDTWMLKRMDRQAHSIDMGGGGHELVLIQDKRVDYRLSCCAVNLNDCAVLPETSFHTASSEVPGARSKSAVAFAPTQRTREDIQAVLKTAKEFASLFPAQIRFDMSLLAMAALLPYNGPINKDFCISVLGEELWEQWCMSHRLDTSYIALLNPSLQQPLDVQYMACLHFILAQHYMHLSQQIKSNAFYQACLTASQQQPEQTSPTEAEAVADA